MSRHVSVRLFTFDNHPAESLWNYYQIWVGGMVRGRGLYVIKPDNPEQDTMMRRVFRYVEGFKPNEVEDIMNFIYKKL